MGYLCLDGGRGKEVNYEGEVVWYLCWHRTLRDSWEKLKQETESSGRIHVGMAQKILDEIHHTVKEFREQQRDLRKKVQ